MKYICILPQETIQK